MRMPSRYRRANHVGGVRIKLAKMLVKAFEDEGIKARCDPKNLWPAQGYWRQVEQDVMAWEGFIEVWRHDKWQKQQLGSWERMTTCIRGFTLQQDGMFIDVNAKHELPPDKRFGIIKRMKGLQR